MHAWSDLRSQWRTALAFHVLMQLLGFALFAPLLTFVASWLVRATGSPVISNFDMAAFALSPMGIVFVLVMVALVGALLLAEFVGHSWIAGHAIMKRRATLRTTIAAMVRQLPRLFALATGMFLRLALLALPFLAILAAVWFTTLAGRDVNYYLAEHPPEWRRAMLVGAVLGLGFALLAAWQVAQWLFAVPVLLAEKVPPRRALQRSRELTRGRLFRTVAPLVVWGLVVVAIAFVLGWLFRLASDAGLDWAGTTISRVLPLVTLYLVVTTIGAAIHGALWIAGHQFLTTRLYLESVGSIERQPLAPESEPAGGERRLAVLLLKSLPVALLLAGGAVWFMATRVNLHSEVAVTAHRGASINNPENTLAAFRAARDASADFIELDVQRTRDQVITVVHDGDLMRLGGDGRKVQDLTAAELATIDVGRKYGAEFVGEFAPTLDQVFDLVQGRVKINIELKYNFPDPGLAPAVIELLRARGAFEQVVITSLDYNALLQVEEIEPRLVTGHIVTAAVGNVTRSKADFLSLNAARASASLVRRAHAAGKQIHVWTVNTPEAMLRMIERGVDNIITDDPALLVRVVRERNALSRAELLGLRLRVLFDFPPREVTDPAAVKSL
jgi:glycerophosphoryl diester phosphodiesterase